MQFRYGSDVHREDGKKIGKVKQVVIDPTTEEVTHIILRKGVLLKEDKVLPISLVKDANKERVDLYEIEGSVDDLPEYKEDHFVELHDASYAQPHVGGSPFLFDYPPVGGYEREEQAQRIKTKERSNLPGDVTPLREDIKIKTIDDQHVGNVEEIIVDPKTDKATHIVVSKGLLLVEEKLVPVEWIKDITAQVVQLAVDRKVIENLPEYQREEKVLL